MVNSAKVQDRTIIFSNQETPRVNSNNGNSLPEVSFENFSVMKAMARFNTTTNQMLKPHTLFIGTTFEQ